LCCPSCCRWFSSALGAASESFADALERFCAAPPRHLLRTQQSADAAADVAAALVALQAPVDADSSSKKERKKQEKLQQELVQKQLVVSQSRMAQVDAQGTCWSAAVGSCFVLAYISVPSTKYLQCCFWLLVWPGEYHWVLGQYGVVL
jgi:hypothetical protein